MLSTRAALLVALAVCVYLTSTTMLPSFREAAHKGGLFVLFGRVVGTLISVMVASRSSYLGDRVFFGVIAGTIVVDFVTDVFRPSPSVDLAIAGLETLAWAGAAVTCFVLLMTSRRQRPD
jgi:hypothetical protein